MLFKKLRPYAVVSEHLPNALPTQQLDNLRVTHQYKVTRHGLSYEAILFSSETIPGETFHCAKMFVVIREESPDEGLFEKEPASTPPEIHNVTATPSAPGDPIESSVFNASNWAEDIALVNN